jgi:hypothetical protein
MYKSSFTEKWFSVILLNFDHYLYGFGNLSEFDVTYSEKKDIGSRDYVFDGPGFLSKNHGLLLNRIKAFQTRDFKRW